MANYQTHRNIGITSSLIVTSLFVANSNLINFEPLNFGYNLDINYYTIVLAFIIGVIGSLAPDIDLETSIPARMFRFAFYSASFILSIYFINDININQYIKLDDNISNILTIIISIIISILIIKLFERNVIHRGLFHSIPFALFLSLSFYELGNLINEFIEIDLNSMVIGSLFLTGYITHLLLDEFYSVDFKNNRIKGSIGTALKLFSTKNTSAYILLYIVIGIEIWRII